MFRQAAKAISVLSISTAVLAAFPITILALMALLALGNEVRLNRSLDFYVFVWAIFALFVTAHNMLSGTRNFHQPTGARTGRIIAFSTLVLVSCPAFWSDWI